MLVLTLSFVLFRPRQPVAEVIVPTATEPVKAPVRATPDHAPRPPLPVVEAIPAAPLPEPIVNFAPDASIPRLPEPALSQPMLRGVKYTSRSREALSIEGDSSLHKWTMEGSMIGGKIEIEDAQIDIAQESIPGARERGA